MYSYLYIYICALLVCVFTDKYFRFKIFQTNACQKKKEKKKAPLLQLLTVNLKSTCFLRRFEIDCLR